MRRDWRNQQTERLNWTVDLPEKKTGKEASRETTIKPRKRNNGWYGILEETLGD